ncbi:MAG: tyrosyl-tRNA synthetase [Patescibacteria group bacterium]|nr:tyrosyl-tRNA synthetase [Patescibacteria group bacterium]
MTLSEELTWRGFVNQTTLKDISSLDAKKRSFYMGFDASADSQQAGNLAGMMFAKTFLRHGYTGYLLAGGSTSLIGDPGGKDKERPLQDEATIAHNVKRAGEQLKAILKGHDFTLVNNLDWTKDMRVLPFLRDIGKYFSMTPLIQRDYIANRLGEGGAGISYAEFSYTILQGFDYLHLYDNYGVTLQLGGSDQWGNCLSGVDLIRKARGAEVDVLTLNLVINKATGKKFGKSEAGAVWLDPKKTSPTQFYQFWINSDDDGVEGYLKTFTELDKEAIDRIMHHHKEAPQLRTAQTQLAKEVTTIVHGSKETEQAQAVTEYLVGKASIGEAGAQALAVMRQEQPSAHSNPTGSIVDTLVSTGLASSNTEARRLIAGNAIAINGQKVNREDFTADDFKNGRLLLRKGKKFKDTALVEL